ncbi:hypothetical protein [Polaribacter sp. BM10]|uniref:hypothetical protein n=1 Tax=Polaribacter sp. BM10 TaxID=1529069 RepID=UPI0011EA5A94|nr:hypothetical protein [Polaribacter sp. BM10]
MSKLNYLNMMLSGYYKNPELLKIYLIRQQQIAERDNFLSLVEFYDNCNITLNNIKEQILKLNNERQKELYWILSKQKTENRDTTEIQKEIDFLKPDNFKIPLLSITNQQFTGHLNYSDIEFIENVIKQIIIYVDEKKDYTLQCNEGNYFYSGSENKLYTGRDFFIKIYLSKGNLKFPINFPDLIPKYYDLALSEYLTSEKNKAKSFFSKKLVILEFINSEIEKIKILQNGIEDFINKNKNGTFNHKKEQLKYCKRYSAYLVEKFKEVDKIEPEKPKQKEENSKEEVKIELHNHIFKNNAFEVWQSMFEEFEIKESSRTDVKFMFEIMKGKSEGLIYDTVSQQKFLEWITDTYDGLIVDKTSNYNKTPARMKAYLRAKKVYKK